MRFRSTCFAARQLVTAELHSHEVVLGRFRANSQGVVSGRVTIPWRTEPGRHTFELEGRHPNRKYSTRIRVLDDRRPGRSEPGGRGGLGTNAPSGGPGHRVSQQQLAATGKEKALTLGGTAAGLVAAGGGTLMVVRRRRSS
ncbi:hypothetical protein [Streptomyces sp900116325]|uniref:hypothetical protein n=1 Tax=Streptomyces sp. 900116325 TaxID=3154295 RepID=UPI0033BBA686